MTHNYREYNADSLPAFQHTILKGLISISKITLQALRKFNICTIFLVFQRFVRVRPIPLL